jgi:hypothetical protein
MCLLGGAASAGREERWSERLTALEPHQVPSFRGATLTTEDGQDAHGSPVGPMTIIPAAKG